MILFGITVTKELRQFHNRPGITHRPSALQTAHCELDQDNDVNQLKK